MARADWMFSAAVARFRASASFSRRMASDSAICTFASFSPVTASEFDLDTRTLFSRSASAGYVKSIRDKYLEYTIEHAGIIASATDRGQWQTAFSR